MTHATELTKYHDEPQSVDALLASLSWTDAQADATTKSASWLIASARQIRRKPGEIETFLREYGLTTNEGKALMTLAEALLRIPDADTANALIRDKVDSAAWPRTKTDDWMLKATALGLNITRRTLNSIIGKLGEPMVRTAVKQAMKIMGRQFVLGRTIEEAIKNGRDFEKQGYILSYDMLGEGARTFEDAEKYYKAYVDALETLGRYDAPKGSGISVKLSALHPRYEFSHETQCVPSLTEQLINLCRIAAKSNLRLTVDAEEADRLETSLKIIAAVAAEPSLENWDGFGLAVQAYQKRGLSVIDRVLDMAKKRKKPLHIRLVKGAYWDTEIKHAQSLGLPDYPVFTRKQNTDLSYLACAKKMLANRSNLICLFGTHNAHTIAAVTQLAGETRHNFELQRLHGMGENLYSAFMKDHQDIPVSVYAPVGRHEELLAYLVRRLLENGANSSFVHKIFDEAYEPAELASDVIEDVKNHPQKRHPKIPKPSEIYQLRENSKGMDLNDRDVIEKLQKEVQKSVFDKSFTCKALTSGISNPAGERHAILNPANSDDVLGHVDYTEGHIVDHAFKIAKKAQTSWENTLAEKRAQILERAADLLEERMVYFMGIAVREAGKTWDTAVDEVREAVDFCRYYAKQGRLEFDEGGIKLPSITGEESTLTLHGRGIWVCISPWNFPLAIFMGQVAAALMAGNAVIAKPAEQTPLIAHEAVKLLHEAGVPEDVLHYLPGDGNTGARITKHPDVAGVAFTGSTDVARTINRTLAEKEGPIARLIAETGGMNAMMVDSSALPEQVIDDVIISAFGSAGQRCSALRVLCIQEDVAERTIRMLRGAMEALKVSNPFDISSDIGPVIDRDARDILYKHLSRMNEYSKVIARAPLQGGLDERGMFFAPIALQIEDLDALAHEVFGPVLHVLTYKTGKEEELIKRLNEKGYGLTFGVHSRIESHVRKFTNCAEVGNAYVNRSIIGAIVGSQPFGGRGLSGTGPKAGGPFYLHAFATEKVVTVNTTASGGNAMLVSLDD
ncbi:MAG: bifunctional proline dehydrogenase/L-glutamate gamma-semialdehyde dehydrogenase [Micavibrio sp.]|nr:bifunctional proline dehydrogenase/L-glutamate gamma-semialdehyde dehydrogenase [Micavibrio sp.]